MNTAQRQKNAAYNACIPLLALLAANGFLRLVLGRLSLAEGSVAAEVSLAAAYLLSMGAAFLVPTDSDAVGWILPSPCSRLRVAALLLMTPFAAAACNAAAAAVLAGFGLSAAQSAVLWPQNTAAQALFVLHMTVLPAVLEELLFRKKTACALLVLGRRRAIWVSALLFAVAHPALAVQPGAFVMGAALAWAYFETGSLLPGMAVHLFNNALAAAVTARPEWNTAAVGVMAAAFVLGTVLWLAAPKGRRAAEETQPMGAFLTGGPFLAYMAIALILTVSNVERIL